MLFPHFVVHISVVASYVPLCSPNVGTIIYSTSLIPNPVCRSSFYSAGGQGWVLDFLIHHSLGSQGLQSGSLVSINAWNSYEILNSTLTLAMDCEATLTHIYHIAGNICEALSFAVCGLAEIHKHYIS